MTEEKQPVSLASLLTPSKTVTVDYPTLAGFTVDLCYLAREELLKLRKKCVKTKWDKIKIKSQSSVCQKNNNTLKQQIADSKKSNESRDSRPKKRSCFEDNIDPRDER